MRWRRARLLGALAALLVVPRTSPALLEPGSAAASSGPTVQESVPSFEREVYGIEVTDEQGQPYDHPLLGGLNIPRPQLVDIDGDGDLDLFVQERSDAVMLFEQVGTRGTPRYRWRADRYADLAVGEWYHFVDVDDDGDFDLLAEQPYSLIRYWRNDGSPTDPDFVLVTETLEDVGGEPLFSDRQNIPKLADIDCDGRLDLMLGRLEGTITRYEEDGADVGGAPVFRKVTDRFEGIEIIGQVLGGSGKGVMSEFAGGSLHGANTMALEDIDGDGDLDLFWGDFFEPGLLFIRNTGSCASPGLAAEPIPFPPDRPIRTSGYNAPGFGDLDSDGDADILLGVLGGAFNPNRTTIANLYHLEQTEPLTFVVRTDRYLSSVDVGSESLPAFADLDADGDLDLLLGNKIEPEDPETGRLYRFENVGSPESPRFRLRGALEYSGEYHYGPTFGDIDADGDLDFLLASWSDQIALVRNQGTAAEPSFVIEDPAFVTLTRGRNAVPTLGDIDGDGDLDLFVGESSGALNFYRNEGDASSPRYQLVTDEFEQIDTGRRSAPTLVDIDTDGDLDLVVGSESEGLALYRNTGSATVPRWAPGESLGVAVHPFSTPAFADIDNDSDPDLFAGGIGGGIIFFRNTGG